MRRVGVDVVPALVAARAGSKEALGQALEACRAYLQQIAREELDDPRLRAKAGASDLVQDTLLEAQRDFARFRGETEAELLAWLRRLLRNNLANFRRWWRKDKRRADREVPLEAASASDRPTVPLPAPAPSPSTQAVRQEQGEALRRALERLPDDYRQVLALRYEGECSFEEVGRRMGRSANAAQKLWARAVERLQTEMDQGP
jgi:RNA polymerase sigma-70 factor (ECF subfamily)